MQPFNRGKHSLKNNKREELPRVDDVITTENEINRLLEKHLKEVGHKNKLSEIEFRDLCSLTLVHVSMFNKRRSSEVAKMTLKQYNQRINGSDGNLNKDLWKNLNEGEKTTAAGMTLINIVVTKNRKAVPVLLDEKMQSAVRRILKYRSDFVDEKNRYVFGIPNLNSTTFMSAHKELKKWIEIIQDKLKLEKPDLIVYGKLRKLFCSTLRYRGMDRNYDKILNVYLGHGEVVHNKDYIVQQAGDIIGIVPKLLLTYKNNRQSGCASKGNFVSLRF